MGVFDSKYFDSISVMNDVLAVEARSWERQGVFDDGFFDTVSNGWKVLDANTLGYNGSDNGYDVFYGEQLCYWSAQCNILGKYDNDGKLTSIGVSFWGTGDDKDSPTNLLNTLSDLINDLMAAISDGFAENYTSNAFSRLIGSVVEFAQQNDLTGSDITFSGHSLGGLAVNSMATLSALGAWNGFFEDSKYVALASPTQNVLDDKVLNIGFENDPVFRVLEGSSLTSDSLLIHDKPLETCTNNIVTFDDFYADQSWWNINAIWNPGAAGAHNAYKYYYGIKSILESEVYNFTDIDSNIIVSSLSDSTREKTWVEDLNKGNVHTGTTFIIGSDDNDLIKGGQGNDYLVGGGGNDIFKDQGGFNVIYGGSGENTYSIQTGINNFETARDSNGNLFFKFSNGDITKTENVDYITTEEVYYNWWWPWQENIKEVSYHATIQGLETDKVIYKYADSYYAEEQNNYEVYASSNNKSNWLFSGDTDSILHSSGKSDNFVSGQGDDIMFGGSGNDTFLFYNDYGNDKIYNFDSKDKVIFMSNTDIVSNDDIMNHLSYVGQDAIFTFGENSVTLVGVDTLSSSQVLIA